MDLLVSTMSPYPFYSNTYNDNDSIAFMVKDNVIMIGGNKGIKNLVFVFSYFGKLLNVINVSLCIYV